MQNLGFVSQPTRSNLNEWSVQAIQKSRIILRYPADQPLFTLVNSDGGNHEGEELGLLLYKGGTVCDDSFDTTAADAICRYMGYSAATRWTIEESFNIQSEYDINLDDVQCSSAEWLTCSFSVENNCGHDEDVFLSCAIDSVSGTPAPLTPSPTPASG